MAEDGPVKLTVYHPHEPNLPYVAVVIFDNGDVQGFAAETASEAHEVLKVLTERIGIIGPSA